MGELPALDASDFMAFFRAIHGQDPFPWQQRLSAQLCSTGWPRCLDLPTGTGKTAALDVAVFHLALEAGRTDRRAPLRIVYVVDRRTIVDQAYDRARMIVRAIGDSRDVVVARVRSRLQSIGRDGIALRATMLRGAIARSDMWARSPDQPLIAISTVDQIGSRLLFRGYGVSDGMKPIHAGLLGNDVLYLLDEVHLSEPFRETLTAVGERYRRWAETELPRRFDIVEMSATPARSTGGAFRLANEDREHRVLSRRLNAPKPVRLVETRGVDFFKEIERAAKMLAKPPGTRVAIVVNRVATARDVHARLGATLNGADVWLITGRMRPIDRARLEGQLIGRIKADEARAPLERSLVVVATQCIEAGADFDFDAMISECSSLDALRQRFGRLDRLGLNSGARGVIVVRRESMADDAVYGDAIGATWRWLEQQANGNGEVDFGLAGLTVPDDAQERGLLAPRSLAPVLLPAHLDAWVQTAPMPESDPEVALWLHGPRRGLPDVQVVWRADLSTDLVASAAAAGGEADAAREMALAIVEAIPPAAGEAMAVPYMAVRRWLEGIDPSDVADVEGVRSHLDEAEEERGAPHRRSTEPRAAVVWRGDRSSVVLGKQLRPGDTIVVPASYGGIAFGTWAPEAFEPVRDVAELAVMMQRGRAMLRLHPAVAQGLCRDALPAVPSPTPLAAEDVDDGHVARGWLSALTVPVDADREVAALLQALKGASAERRGLEVVRVAGSDGEYLLVTGRTRIPVAGDEISGEVTTEGDSGSFTGVEITLAEHMRGVRSIAGEFARRVGLPPAVVRDVELAARWHDAGKADPRFQRLLHGGSEVRALAAPEPLAKSRMPMNDRRARQRAFQASGYPPGMRHEVMSVALMIAGDAPVKALANDWDLVLHLVASHHGHCRPFPPWAEDPSPLSVALTVDGVEATASSDHGLARLDSGVGERYWRLVRRYGWWGLAWIETVLRLGDHRRSELEQQMGRGRPAADAA